VKPVERVALPFDFPEWSGLSVTRMKQKSPRELTGMAGPYINSRFTPC
jgi:hypothetical protein